MTLLRELIHIPDSVGEGDFVMRAAEGADLGKTKYVVTDQLRGNFDDALKTIGHAVSTGRSQAKFVHGSFGAGKSHYMAVLREILHHNPDARLIKGLGEPVDAADIWLRGKKILTLTLHMLDAASVEQAILEAYLKHVTTQYPDVPVPAVHRSDELLRNAEDLRNRIGDEAFFAALGEGGGPSSNGGTGLAALNARKAGWTPTTYAYAAAALPGTKERDSLVSALTTVFFSAMKLTGEYLDLDTGLQVITRHAKQYLGVDAMVLFLDEFMLWLFTKISDHTFVKSEAAKLNKLVESSDAARPLPLISFVARQRNLEEFLGSQVGGTEKAVFAEVTRSNQGRLGQIVLADTNLPEIVEKRLLEPLTPAARTVIDDAFAAVRASNRQVWDTLLLGEQYGDAGIGSDAPAFRRLYPFSPALVATLVALSQALQRERTAIRIMYELLVTRRDTLRVNDLISVSDLFEPLVLHGDLPERPELKLKFELARAAYKDKLRPALLARHGVTDTEAAENSDFVLDDKLIKTLLLGALVPDVPALHNLTAAKLHALNYGSIDSPIPGYENEMVLDRMRRLDIGLLHVADGPDPVISLKLSEVDFDQLLDLVPHQETNTGVLQQLIRDMVCGELGLGSADGTFGEMQHLRDWRGRRHPIQVKFGNVRDKESMPDSALKATGETWRIVIDYPFDLLEFPRNSDKARIETLERGSRTVFWLPFYLTADLMGRVAKLAKINYLLGDSGTGDRINTYAADWSAAQRQQGKVYLQQLQGQLRSSLLDALKQAYGAANPNPADVEDDESVAILHTLAEGLRIGLPRGGNLKAAFENLTGELLAWAYPGKPNLPDDERPITRAELAKVLHYAQRAAADETHGVVVETADRRTVQRICNPLHLGELIDHRYVLTGSTCRWTGFLLQWAAGAGYTGRFPVSVLREFLTDPDRGFGFDRDLQNLIIMVFALEQQLAAFRNGSPEPLPAIAALHDDMELRHPPMPEETRWHEAFKRGGALFGQQLPSLLIPANVAEFAAIVRREAGAARANALSLIESLSAHAAILGIDPAATTGRLAGARRVTQFLRDVADEREDVTVVDLVAGADFGGLDDKAAAATFKQAADVTRALGDQQRMQILKRAAEVAVTNDACRGVIGRLREAAARDQFGANLVDALETAGAEATGLLIAPLPPPPPPPADKPVHRAEVEAVDEWDKLADQIRAEVQAGRRVTITWDVQ